MKLHTLEKGPESNLRGLSVPDDKTIWFSGSSGWIGRSRDAGVHLQWKQVEGFPKTDFRSLYALDEQTILIANAGSPAHILRSADGGFSWKEVYTNKDSLAFIDAISFWDEMNGIAIGDPIKGHYLLLLTHDGGLTWKESEGPAALAGEACFAASGTCLRTSITAGNKGYAWLVTGGIRSRLLLTRDYGKTWSASDLPILQGTASRGAFSVLFTDSLKGIIVGGDYASDTSCTNNCFYTSDGGKTWKSPVKAPGGYRSCVEMVSENTFIACGTSGVDVSLDGGKSWTNLDKGRYNVVLKARKGNRIYLAGEKGCTALLEQ